MVVDSAPERNWTLVEAIRSALDRAMSEDPAVVVFGEDVAVNGGVFRTTDGLLEKFGAERIFDTPLAETAIAGVAIGLAATGFKPVAEIQFTGFILSTLDQIANHAARLRNRTRGRLSCPLVLRAPYGGGIHAPEHHSESFEAIFAHLPGIRVVVPSTPASAYHLLLAAIQDPDPVIFLEPKRLYRAHNPVTQEVIEEIELDQSRVVKQGRDLTLITWGAMLSETLEAASQLGSGGIDTEIIDLLTLKPVDLKTILGSVSKTGRVCLIHEAPLTGGFGAEISARIAEKGLFDLRAPVLRVTGWDTIMPLSRLEHCYMPGVERIVDAAKHLMEFN